MHGGAQATIFDACTSLSLFAISKAGFWTSGGVSRNLNVTYLKPMRVESVQEVTVECCVLQVGKRLAVVSAKMVGDDGGLYSTCEHHKVNVDAKL